MRVQITENQAKILLWGYIKQCMHEDLNYHPNLDEEWELFLSCGSWMVDGNLSLFIENNRFYLEEVI